jgi:molybdate transport system substrate-binding protein
VSEEPDVRSALARVVTGNADAALVYASDVRSAGDSVQGIPFPEATEAVNAYPIAVIADRPQAEPARAFRDLLTGPDGRAVLDATGFGGP